MSRRAERVPASWPVEVRIGSRARPAQLYSLSARGAFLATAGPALRRTLVHITLPLPSQDLRVAGEVVLTNVPGNLRKRNLPIGMGIRFLGLVRRGRARAHGLHDRARPPAPGLSEPRHELSGPSRRG